jgi:prophage antirepressor-like protein
MENALTIFEQVFELDDHQFQVVTIAGEPWWFVADVEPYLEYGRGNLADIIRKDWSNELTDGVDVTVLRSQNLADLKILLAEKRTDPKSDRLKGINSITLLSESGVYIVAMLSRKPQGKRLRRWLAREVLPSIRRTGLYTRSESQPEMTTFSCVAPEFKAALELAQLFGLEGNQAILAASKAFTREYGVNPQQLIGLTQLAAPQQEELLTATELGKRTDVSRNSVNPLLEGLGLLTGYRDRRNKLQWVLTTKGKEFGVYLDVGKDRSNGTPIQQIKWYASIIDFIDAACNSDEIDFENWRKRS